MKKLIVKLISWKIVYINLILFIRNIHFFFTNFDSFFWRILHSSATFYFHVISIYNWPLVLYPIKKNEKYFDVLKYKLKLIQQYVIKKFAKKYLLKVKFYEKNLLKHYLRKQTTNLFFFVQDETYSRFSVWFLRCIRELLQLVEIWG